MVMSAWCGIYYARLMLFKSNLEGEVKLMLQHTKMA